MNHLQHPQFPAFLIRALPQGKAAVLGRAKHVAVVGAEPRDLLGVALFDREDGHCFQVYKDDGAVEVTAGKPPIDVVGARDAALQKAEGSSNV